MRMHSLIDRVKTLATHKFVRQTLFFQAAAAAGTFAQAVVSVVLARRLGPQDYGIYALAFSVASIASIVLASGAQDAVTPHIMRAWTGGDAPTIRRTLGFLLKFIALTACAVALAAVALPVITGHAYGNAAVGHYASIILVASLVSTSFFALTSLMLQVSGRIAALSALAFVDQILRYGAVVVLVLGGYGLLGAALGHLIGAIVVAGIAAGIWAWLARRHVYVPRLRELPQQGQAASLTEHLGSSAWVSADRGLAMLYGALPVAVSGLFLPSAQVAYFKIALGYLQIGFMLLGPISVLLNTEFPRLQAVHGGKIRSHFLRVSLGGMALSTIGSLCMVLVAPKVFHLLYGDQYAASIPYVMGFLGLGVVYGLGIGLGSMWRAIGKVRVSILINLVTLGLGIPLGIWLIMHWQIWGAVMMVTVWYTISHVASFIYLLRVLKSRS